MLYELPEAQTVAEQEITLVEAQGDREAVRVFLIPIGPSALRSARMALVNADHPIEDYAVDIRFDAFCREICQRSIVRWEGIGRAGQPAPINEVNLEALLSDPDVLARLQQKFIMPFMAREAEKNVSSPSSDGTLSGTTGAKDTVHDAQSAVPPVPTRSVPRKRAKAKPSGR